MFLTRNKPPINDDRDLTCTYNFLLYHWWCRDVYCIPKNTILSRAFRNRCQKRAYREIFRGAANERKS